MLREVLRLPHGWSLMMETDSAEPYFKSPGGVSYRPDTLRFQNARHLLHRALSDEENRLIVAGGGHIEDYRFWCIRRARLWLEWNPETKTWDEYAEQVVA